MQNIEIYTSARCAYCSAAKALLESRQLEWHEWRIDTDPVQRQQMLTRAPGARTVPQIFVNGHHVGGYRELAAASHDGTLDQLLAGDPD